MTKLMLPSRFPAVLAVLVALPVWGLVAGCASVPPAPSARVVTYEQKLGWILRLEDQRVLRDPVAPSPVSVPAAGGRVAVVASPPAADLVQLLADPDGRIRRRAAVAIGRVGLRLGAKPLAATLAGDEEPEVRQVAAFSLGLIRDASAIEALRAGLRDKSPLVQGRAAEALSVLGDTASAPAIGEMVSAYVKAGAVAGLAPDDMADTHPPAVDAFRLGVLALGRLKAYDALARAVLGPSGAPLVTWWPVAAALQRTEDRRALGALLALARGASSVGRAFAARGLGVLKDPAAIDTLTSLARDWPLDTKAAISAVEAMGLIGDRRAGGPLLTLLQAKGLDPLLHLEVITALGATRSAGALGPLMDLVSHASPAVRAAAFRSLREIDPASFLLVLSGLDADRHWSVRAAIASILGTCDRDAALPRLSAMMKDRICG